MPAIRTTVMLGLSALALAACQTTKSAETPFGVDYATHEDCKVFAAIVSEPSGPSRVDIDSEPGGEEGPESYPGEFEIGKQRLFDELQSKFPDEAPARLRQLADAAWSDFHPAAYRVTCNWKRYGVSVPRTRSDEASASTLSRPVWTPDRSMAFVLHDARETQPGACCSYSYSICLVRREHGGLSAKCIPTKLET